MEIKTTYVCDGAIYCGFKPKGAKVKEERQILYPIKDYKLQDKDGKRHSSVWLKDGDSQENYTEVESEEKEPQLKTNLEE